MRHQGTPAGGPIMTSGRDPGKEKLPTINAPRQARLTLSLKTVTECDADHIYLQHRPAGAAPQSKHAPPRGTRQLHSASVAINQTHRPASARTSKKPHSASCGAFTWRGANYIIPFALILSKRQR